jgi:hypothetical protein
MVAATSHPSYADADGGYGYMTHHRERAVYARWYTNEIRSNPDSSRGNAAGNRVCLYAVVYV